MLSIFQFDSRILINIIRVDQECDNTPFRFIKVENHNFYVLYIFVIYNLFFLLTQLDFNLIISWVGIIDIPS